MASRRVRLTAREERSLIRDAPVVQNQRMSTAHAATAAVSASSFRSAVPWARAASSRVMAAIRAMLAAREHHWSATLPAMYFRLSGTVPMRRLLIIIGGTCLSF